MVIEHYCNVCAEKLEWRICQVVEKFGDRPHTFSRFDTILACDAPTDEHLATAYSLHWA